MFFFVFFTLWLRNYEVVPGLDHIVAYHFICYFKEAYRLPEQNNQEKQTLTKQIHDIHKQYG